MKESKYLEFKLNLTNTFLKTVSAFANYGTGKIIFGIDDNGTLVGLSDLKNLSLDIENKINDNLHPRPEFRILKDEKQKTLSLIVEEGEDKPYLYKGKAYKRSDTATIEVEALELNRLILLGTHQYFEELKTKQQDLSFDALKTELKEKLALEHFTQDVLKTLNLYDEQQGFNYAAELLADKNTFAGIDMARFGRNEDTILDRNLFDKQSILLQYKNALEVFRRYYKYEEIVASERVEKEHIPEKAFREVLANALVHRTWDVKAHIKVSMFEDRIELTSPGGLPIGISEKEYLNGQISQLRNPILGNVFFRLKYIEMFGTGIRRIKEIYKTFALKPIFEVYDHSIKVTLPVLTQQLLLTTDEKVVMDILNQGEILSSSELLSKTSFKKDKLNRLLKNLMQKNYVLCHGKGRGTKYSKI